MFFYLVHCHFFQLKLINLPIVDAKELLRKWRDDNERKSGEFSMKF